MYDSNNEIMDIQNVLPLKGWESVFLYRGEFGIFPYNLK
ncbi:hypothetical protein FH5_03260 [Priestia endophytica]|nr:hypothetical protein FH5_03260 [Priestia endophytica]